VGRDHKTRIIATGSRHQVWTMLLLLLLLLVLLMLLLRLLSLTFCPASAPGAGWRVHADAAVRLPRGRPHRRQGTQCSYPRCRVFYTRMFWQSP